MQVTPAAWAGSAGLDLYPVINHTLHVTVAWCTLWSTVIAGTAPLGIQICSYKCTMYCYCRYHITKYSDLLLKVYYELCKAPKIVLCTPLLQIPLHFVFRSTPISIPNSVHT